MKLSIQISCHVTNSSDVNFVKKMIKILVVYISYLVRSKVCVCIYTYI